MKATTVMILTRLKAAFQDALLQIISINKKSDLKPCQICSLWLNDVKLVTVNVEGQLNLEIYFTQGMTNLMFACTCFCAHKMVLHAHSCTQIYLRMTQSL